MTHNGQLLDYPLDIVNAFANYFSEVYIASTNPLMLNFHPSSIDINITLEPFTEEEVLHTLKRSKNKLTRGTDGVPSFVVRDCAYAFAKPLTYLFNLSLATMTFPNAWKVARVCPVFKSGDVSWISNYRDISILTNFSKTFEECIYGKLFPQISQLITTKQHGFFNCRSTVTNLVCFLEYVYSGINDNCQVDVIYTYFSKAFDRLDHGILAAKMNLLGFHPNLIMFFMSYLSDRVQFVEYMGHRSNTFSATSGAPQGSVLAPLIFSIFVNDIVSDLRSEVLLFADDVKLFRVIEDVGDCGLLQQDINRIWDWCEQNKLPLNINKCKKITISLKKNEIVYNYRIGPSILGNCDCVNDLGVMMDKKLSFGQHIEDIVQSALKSLGFLIRSASSFNNLSTISVLFNTFVKSKLSYATLAWSPSYNYAIDRLEAVQRRFLKYLSFRLDGVYPQRGVNQLDLLNRFNFLPLKNARTCASLLFLYKLCNNCIDCPELLVKLNFLVPRVSTRNTDLFYLNTPNTNLFKKSPLYQTCSHYNTVHNQANIDLFAQGLSNFRGKIKKHAYHILHNY